MRHWKRKWHIIWLLLTDKYTSSTKYDTWWLWNGETKITFGKKEFHRESLEP